MNDIIKFEEYLKERQELKEKLHDLNAEEIERQVFDAMKIVNEEYGVDGEAIVYGLLYAVSAFAEETYGEEDANRILRKYLDGMTRDSNS